MYKKDRNGLVEITRGGKVARVLPESVETWVSLDWKVTEEKPSGENKVSEPTPVRDAAKTAK